MKEIKLTKGKSALVDDEDYEYLNQFKWQAHSAKNDNWYAQKYHRRGDKPRTIFMHTFLTNYKLTDHKDGNGLNNQKDNLRETTHSKNNANKKVSRSKTGFRGVIFSQNGYEARISVNSCKIYLGRSKNKIQAALWYNAAALHYFGEFAVLNVIPE